ncbi:branched-chain amino acid aminotransferase [Winogradskyella epiphytica]|uniref:Branched-chain-amino-acid aminotransferase n=1 Tax=Winogradskyella epiphytica TaxID=262005 RepID=A0A2V4YD33_9FLAO|nr:branched-chain amino acid transaminase [Winogradskyella epiphytica]PYE81127.1 branched-chain amino acid aminotransferase [Winogradskyella epiphytica]GGW67033.1 branched-chain amino acid aminotransferase [Winogradskyella epiphytica]
MYYNENTVIYLDGKFVKANEASTDLYSQTMHYGYGVFEGIRAYAVENGTQVFKAEEHYDRLKKSAELINIPFDYNVQGLIEVTYELLKRNNLTDAYVRPLVFCDPNMSLARPNNVSIMICAWEWGAYLGDKQLRLTVSSYCRPHPRSIKIEAKVCGHYVNSILATNEAKDKGFDEALLLDSDGYLAEGPGANLFFEKDDVLFTPQLGNILPGITRATVLELAEELGIKVEQGLFKPEALAAADSAFYCGTAAEVIGIESVDDKKFPKAWNETLGKKLKDAYSKRVRQPKAVQEQL